MVVVASGEPHPDDAVWLQDEALVIAADGGAGWLETLGRTPDLLVGDLDSIDPRLLADLERTGVAVERHPADKEASDAELALLRAAEAGDEVVLIGALVGLRLDHELANLLLIADRRWRDALDDLRIVRGRTLVRALHGGESLAVEAAPGSTVTLLPIGGDAEGVRTAGLRYPLDGDALRLGRSRGLSNQVAQAPASVSLARGTLL
ncbi:MAG TPA: thiamine diphosphokinase, partial [Candidatus Limnocylindria bacterium]|nr:thiamine diphosphokinase [Candidatus Limnocylindria bacterium]